MTRAKRKPAPPAPDAQQVGSGCPGHIDSDGRSHKEIHCYECRMVQAAHSEHAKLRERAERAERSLVNLAVVLGQDEAASKEAPIGMATSGVQKLQTAHASLLAAAKEAREAAGAILHEWDRQGFGPNGTLEWHHIYQLRAAHAALAKVIP